MKSTQSRRKITELGTNNKLCLSSVSYHEHEWLHAQG